MQQNGPTNKLAYLGSMLSNAVQSSTLRTDGPGSSYLSAIFSILEQALNNIARDVQDVFGRRPCTHLHHIPRRDLLDWAKNSPESPGVPEGVAELLDESDERLEVCFVLD